MGLQSQFSLSLEVTKVLGPAAIAQSGNAFVKWARDIQRNGSDILIEQDLGGLFSRFHIDPGFAQEFKECALRTSDIKSIGSYLPIALQSGPGATVQRALQDPSFMPMVIHLSMFGATHEFGRFAEALSEVLRARVMDDKSKEPAFFPPKTIKGTIQVCVEQTSGYQWHLLVDSIMRKLGLPQYVPGKIRKDMPRLNAVEHFYSLSITALRACMEILLALQKVYRDHMMVVNGSRGIVPIILWAHFVLGLNVTVKNSPHGDVAFGEGHASVVIEYPHDTAITERCPPSLYLMGPAPFRDVLYTIRDHGRSVMEPIGRRMIPIKGYAAHLFSSLPVGEESTECLSRAAQCDLSHYAGAIAILLCQHLYDRITYHGTNLGKHFLGKNPKPVFESIQLVLDEFYDLEQIKAVAKQLRGIKVLEYPPPPSLSQYEKPDMRRDCWARLLRSVVDLTDIILTFAGVGDIEACKDILIGDINMIEYQGSMLSLWDGREPRCWTSGQTYSSMSNILQDSRDTIEREKSVLFSCHGWSVYQDCLVQKDPAACVRSRIWVHRGIPRYDGVCARRILDGPTNIEMEAKRVEILKPPEDIQNATQEAESAYSVSFVNPHISMSTEEWRVNQCFLQSSDHINPISIGFGALGGAAGSIYDVVSCDHGDGKAAPRTALPSFIRMYPGMAISHGFYFPEKVGGPRICVAQTYGNSLARWLAIVGHSASQSERTIVLRKESTCLDCFIDKACKVDGGRAGLYLVL